MSEFDGRAALKNKDYENNLNTARGQQVSKSSALTLRVSFKGIAPS